jgi:hypothetical protein
VKIILLEAMPANNTFEGCVLSEVVKRYVVVACCLPSQGGDPDRKGPAGTTPVLRFATIRGLAQ